MGTDGHARKNTAQMGGTYKVYTTASSISEDIEQGDGGTHDEVTARRIGCSQGEDTAKRSGDTQEISEGWNKNP